MTVVTVVQGGTLDRLLALTVRRLDVRVEYALLPPDRDGEYEHARRLIRLQEGMAARLHRSVLAHECGHARFGHSPARDPVLGARQERRADEWAARCLIREDDYRLAEAWHDGHGGAIALELGVTADLVETYRGMLHRAPRRDLS